MKKSLFLVIIIFATACTRSFVDKQPQANIIGIPDSATAVQATNGVYAQLRAYNVHVFPWLGISEIASDEADKGSLPTDASFFLELKNYTVTPTSQGSSVLLDGYWSGLYVGINRANLVINNVPAVAALSAALKGRLVAEAKFLRAYFYFNLVRSFGGVPLILSDTLLNNNRMPRAATDQVYALIESDLDEAETVLPLKSAYSAADLGRATQGAAQALLAKVCLYEKKWSRAKALTDSLIASGQYSLYPDFSKLFTQVAKNSVESIFEVQSGAGTTCGTGTQYAQVQLPRASDAPGWGFNDPSQQLIDSFETGDPRLKATVISPGDTLYDGWIVPSDVVNPHYNKKAYIGMGDYSACGLGDDPKDIIILRYAEVLLINAEADNELGQSAGALANLELIRARARGNNGAVLPMVIATGQADLRNAIWHERHAELAMEQDRWWDVVRQGRGAQVFGPQGFVAGKNEVWPIPSNEIALDANLQQNPGY
ncbi:MAG TPA: RagB/SusD family nutrient uptake outer membrane protein [Puia sp.]